MALWGVKLFNFSPSSVFSEWWAMNGHYFRRSTVLVLGLVIVSVLWFVLCSRSDAMGGALPAESEVIHVVIPSDGEQLAGLSALINSIDKNTDSPVVFYIVSNAKGAAKILLWMERALELRRIKREIKVFDQAIQGKSEGGGRNSRFGFLNSLTFVPFYLDKLVPCVRGNLIYINDDCIVQGNIKELAATKIASHHVAAFSSECNELLEDIHPNPGRYNSYLDYGNKIVQKMDIPPETCLFNAGVFVVDMKKFKQWNISAKLEYWATMNVKHKLFLEGPSHVPALVVFHNLYTELDPKWHIVHLGNPPEKVPPYDSDFLHSKACLLHWDGSRKPWLYPSQTGADIWRKYAVYDLVQPSI